MTDDYIMRLKGEGLSFNAIANRLNVEGYKTIHGKKYTAVQVGRALRRLYGGKLPFDVRRGRVAGFISQRRKFEKPTKVVRVPEDWNVNTVYQSLNQLEKVIQDWQHLINTNPNPNQPRLKKVAELLDQMRQAMPKKEIP
jgi:hypothetical protein